MKYKRYKFKWECKQSQQIFQKLVGFSNCRISEMEVKDILKCAHLKSGSKIIDVGCGIGRHAIILAKKGFDVTAIDIARYYLSQARKSARENHVDIEFRDQRASHLTERNRYDLALAFDHTLGLMSKWELHKHFRKIYGSLKPNGIFFVKYAGPRLSAENCNTCTWHRIDDCYVLERKNFKGNFRFEECVMINTRKNEVITFLEKHRAYDLAEVSNLLTAAGFNIWSKQKVRNHLKSIDYKDVFVGIKSE